jgi:hypothetical protein
MSDSTESRLSYADALDTLERAVHAKIRAAQVAIATALDGANTALIQATDEEKADQEAYAKAMSYFAGSMQTYNGIVVGVHFGRAQLMGRNDLFEYTLRSAYHLQEKAMQRAQALKDAQESAGR